MTTIDNKVVQATIDQNGAQLVSLRHTSHDGEYLWQGDPRYWANRAPLLFPIVGMLDKESYLHRGKQYVMGRHGFARFSRFDEMVTGSQRCVLRLTSDEKTRSVYPFDFALWVTYGLKGASLSMRMDIENRGDSPMPFSAGYHPGFWFEGMNPGSCIEDYALVFDMDTVADVVGISKGYRTGTVAKGAFSASEVPLNAALFADDALVLADCRSRQVTLRAQGMPHGVSVSLSKFPYVGFWTVPVEHPPFVCIEPWQGIADAAGAGPLELSVKEGMIVLEPYQAYSLETVVTLF